MRPEAEEALQRDVAGAQELPARIAEYARIPASEVLRRLISSEDEVLPTPTTLSSAAQALIADIDAISPFAMTMIWGLFVGESDPDIGGEVARRRLRSIVVRAEIERQLVAASSAWVRASGAQERHQRADKAGCVGVLAMILGLVLLGSLLGGCATSSGSQASPADVPTRRPSRAPEPRWACADLDAEWAVALPGQLKAGYLLEETKQVYYEDRSMRDATIRLFFAGRFDDGAIGQWVVIPYDGLHAMNDIASQRSTGSAVGMRYMFGAAEEAAEAAIGCLDS